MQCEKIIKNRGKQCYISQIMCICAAKFTHASNGFPVNLIFYLNSNKEL